MKHNEIIEIIKLFDKTQIDLIKIEDESTKLKLCKNSSAKTQANSNKPQEPSAQTLIVKKENESTQTHNAEIKTETELEPWLELESTKKKYYEVKSPMIGNFYRASSPEAKAFVEIGDCVKKGDPLCMIEAMKMLNEIKSEKSGKVVNILVENGSIVDFGKVLFLIEEEDV